MATRAAYAGLLAWACALLTAAQAAQALSPSDVAARGYYLMECRFDTRCVLGQPCEKAWREMRWHLNDSDGIAYREYEDGRLNRGILMMDARWLERSASRAIVMPLREAVASHLTVFDGGGAIYSLQYAGNPGAGQSFLGQCRTASRPPDME